MIETVPSLATTPVLPETQGLLNYALYNKNKPITWPDVMLASVDKIRQHLTRLGEIAGSEDLFFEEIRTRLIECKTINDANVWLASKVRLPPLKVLPDLQENF